MSLLFNISSEAGGVYIFNTQTIGDTSQSPSEGTAFTLRPGQLAIVRQHVSIELRAVQDQLIAAWSVLPLYLLGDCWASFINGNETWQSVEGIYYSLMQASCQHQMFAAVHVALQKYVTAMEDRMPSATVTYPVNRMCSACHRYMYMYTCFCKTCDLITCMYCGGINSHLEQKHDIVFIRVSSPMQI